MDSLKQSTYKGDVGYKMEILSRQNITGEDLVNFGNIEFDEVKTYTCPCCERIAVGERTTDYKRGGMFAYYVKDEVQNIRCFFNDEYHYFGLKIDYCPICGGKV